MGDCMERSFIIQGGSFSLHFVKVVGNLGSYPGSLYRATGEIVTESEVSRVLRGTDKWQSDLGSWGPSTAREGRPKGDITSLTSSCIPPIIILFLILSLLLRTG